MKSSLRQKLVLAFLVPTSLLVQTSTAQKPLSIQIQDPGHGCPVSIHVQQGGFGSVSKVDNPSRINPFQDIHLTLKNDDALAVTSAKIFITGTSPEGRILKAAASNQPENLSKTQTLTIRFTPTDSEIEADLRLAGFTSINTLTFKSITYADGSTWTPSNGNTCRAFTDPLMLISSR